MSHVSQELIDRMIYFIPQSLAKHQIRFETIPSQIRRKNSSEAEKPEGLNEIIAAMPRWILCAHLPSYYSLVLIGQFVEAEIYRRTHRRNWNGYCGQTAETEIVRLNERELKIGLCTLSPDGPMGFKFPSWRTAKFAREVQADWLAGEARTLYDYCLENDLEPYFSSLEEKNGDKSCHLMIRWRGAKFDRLLGLPEHQLFGHHWPRQTDQVALEENDSVDVAALKEQSAHVRALAAEIDSQLRAQFEADMDEECQLVAAQYIPRAQARIQESVASGKNTATIFAGLDGVSAYECFSNGYPSSHSPIQVAQDEAHRIFNRPLFYPSLVARGLCIWARKNQLRLAIRFRPVYRDEGPSNVEVDASWD